MTFSALHDLLNELRAFLAHRSPAEKLQAPNRPHILIIDETGYLPLHKERADYFFRNVSLSLFRHALTQLCVNAFAT